MEPALPQHAGAGRASGSSTSWLRWSSGGYDGYLSLEIFNDRFRSSVRFDGGSRRARSLDVPLRPGRPAPGPDAWHRTISAARAGARRGVRRVRGERGRRRRSSRSCSRDSASRRRAAIERRMSRGGGRTASISSSTASRRASHAPTTPCTALRCARSASASRTLASAVRRADGLQMRRFSQPRGPGELEIPALHAVGGSLLYFMEAGAESHIWETGVRDCSTAARCAGAGCCAWITSRRRCSTRRCSPGCSTTTSLFDVVEGASRARSRIPLGSCRARRSSRRKAGCASRSMARRARSDAFRAIPAGFPRRGRAAHRARRRRTSSATAARLRELGLETLPIPRNYYEDLEARFGLDPDLLERLADCNILYDRDTDGEYFQLVLAGVRQAVLLRDRRAPRLSRLRRRERAHPSGRAVPLPRRLGDAELRAARPAGCRAPAQDHVDDDFAARRDGVRRASCRARKSARTCSGSIRCRSTSALIDMCSSTGLEVGAEAPASMPRSRRARSVAEDVAVARLDARRGSPMCAP